MGDVCGIGPEIAVKALLRPETYDICHPIIVGDSRIVERGVRAVGAKGLTVHPVQKVSDALFQPGTLDVYEVPLACENVDEIPYGKVTVIGGEAAFTCVRKVIELAMANKIDGTITGPLNKEATNLNGNPVGPCRAPFCYLSDEAVAEIARTLEADRAKGMR